MKLNALYESVTQSIIKELEAGVAPWVKPWRGSQRGGIMPKNGATGRSYSGVNIPILWMAAQQHGFARNQWMTFQQAQGLGATVRGGERSTHIVFTKQLTKVEHEEERRFAMMRAYSVFNVAQIDGLPPEPDPEELPEPVRHEAAEAFIKATGASIRLGTDRACYRSVPDDILMPFQGFFTDHEAFYAVTFHELGHWSGAKQRLDRNLTNRFGSKAYAAEELIAELTAAFVCAHVGIKGELRHASYIENWIQLLKDDSKAIFTAASKASQAADFLRAFSETMQEAA